MRVDLLVDVELYLFRDKLSLLLFFRVVNIAILDVLESILFFEIRYFIIILDR